MLETTASLPLQLRLLTVSAVVPVGPEMCTTEPLPSLCSNTGAPRKWLGQLLRPRQICRRNGCLRNSTNHVAPSQIDIRCCVRKYQCLKCMDVDPISESMSRVSHAARPLLRSTTQSTAKALPECRTCQNDLKDVTRSASQAQTPPARPSSQTDSCIRFESTHPHDWLRQANFAR